jgi:regulator of sirC expression with transglutaminase-like and TPR domain
MRWPSFLSTDVVYACAKRHVFLAAVLIAIGVSSREVSAFAALISPERPRTVKTVESILSTPEARIDLATAKLTLDKLTDPTVDIPENLSQVETMARAINAMAGPSASSRQRVTALRTFLYESGTWNENRPFAYDLADPFGRRLRSRLLSYYLITRRGNCVSMPILFVILADRLGLHATLALAPQHLFVKYTDELTGRTFNVEATSGGHVARDEWYRQTLPMSDKAVANGIYLKPLSKTETLAVMAEEVLEFDMAEKRYQEVIDVSDAILTAYPNFVDAMVFQGTASAFLMDTEFRSRYARPDQIPAELRPRFLALSASNRLSFEKAEALGWSQPDGQAQPSGVAK